MNKSRLEKITLADVSSGEYGSLFSNLEAALASDVMKNNYDDFIVGLYNGFNKVINRVSLHSHLREHDSEGRTTVEIVNGLCLLNFPAELDASYNGNCDIVVNQANKYLWLAEAKIDYSNSHVMQGFRQLVDRYASASKIQQEGALLIYCKDNPPSTVISNWKKYLTKADQGSHEYNVTVIESGDDYFVTTHHHKALAKLFKVRHVAISLYDTASDKSALARKDCNHSCEQCCKVAAPN